MSNKPYDFAVLIGRFQPFHNGHKKLVDEALKIADRLIILVGSAYSARTIRNPFTYDERHSVIRNAAVNGERINHVSIHPLPDSLYDIDLWKMFVSNAVAVQVAGMVKPRIALIGNERDHTSFYLRLFPEWTYEPVDDDGVNATEIRKEFFNGGRPAINEQIPEATQSFMQRFRGNSEYPRLMKAQQFYREYAEEWGSGPFVTVDSVVLHGDHILLIEREAGIDAGLLALPGGFLEKNETLYNGAVRELREETKIGLTGEELRSAFTGKVKTYDDVHRSPRGRLITTAFGFRLDSKSPRPVVVGADDAKSAMWLPLAALRMDAMFEDHGHIIHDMIQ